MLGVGIARGPKRCPGSVKHTGRSVQTTIRGDRRSDPWSYTVVLHYRWEDYVPADHSRPYRTNFHWCFLHMWLSIQRLFCNGSKPCLYLYDLTAGDVCAGNLQPDGVSENWLGLDPSEIWPFHYQNFLYHERCPSQKLTWSCIQNESTILHTAFSLQYCSGLLNLLKVPTLQKELTWITEEICGHLMYWSPVAVHFNVPLIQGTMNTALHSFWFISIERHSAHLDGKWMRLTLSSSFLFLVICHCTMHRGSSSDICSENRSDK